MKRTTYAFLLSLTLIFLATSSTVAAKTRKQVTHNQLSGQINGVKRTVIEESAEVQNTVHDDKAAVQAQLTDAQRQLENNRQQLDGAQGQLSSLNEQVAQERAANSKRFNIVLGLLLAVGVASLLGFIIRRRSRATAAQSSKAPVPANIVAYPRVGDFQSIGQISNNRTVGFYNGLHAVHHAVPDNRFPTATGPFIELIARGGVVETGDGIHAYFADCHFVNRWMRLDKYTAYLMAA